MKSQEKTNFFQGEETVSEPCIWSGKLGILLKVREIDIILNMMGIFFIFIERLNKKLKICEAYLFSVQISMFKVSEVLL